MSQHIKPNSRGQTRGAEPCVINFGSKTVDGFAFLSGNFEKCAPEGFFERDRSAMPVERERMLLWPRVRHRACVHLADARPSGFALYRGLFGPSGCRARQRFYLPPRVFRYGLSCLRFWRRLISLPLIWVRSSVRGGPRGQRFLHQQSRD